MYNELKEDVQKHLIGVAAVSLTTDGWTSTNNEGYICVSVHFLNKNFELRSLLLECVKYFERHTSNNLAKELLRVMDEWQLKQQTVAIVSDNAANIKSAIEITGKPHIPCFAHSINLVIQKGLFEISATHSKVKRIVKYFKKSTLATEKLLLTEKQMDFPQLKFKQDMPTRWNSTFIMFNRLLEVFLIIFTYLVALFF